MPTRFKFRPALALLIGVSAVAAMAQPLSLPSTFEPYTLCSLPGGPEIVESSPFGKGLTGRTVTTMKGPEFLPISGGRRLMFAYPGQDFYANMKVEVLLAGSYPASRSALIGDFDHLLSEGGTVRNAKLAGNVNGFDARGLDREKREGGVLGIYLLLDDSTHTAITVYFLNQEEPMQFHTMAEYAAVRDSFLERYTACVRRRLETH